MADQGRIETELDQTSVAEETLYSDEATHEEPVVTHKGVEQEEVTEVENEREPVLEEPPTVEKQVQEDEAEAGIQETSEVAPLEELTPTPTETEALTNLDEPETAEVGSDEAAPLSHDLIEDDLNASTEVSVDKEDTGLQENPVVDEADEAPLSEGPIEGGDHPVEAREAAITPEPVYDAATEQPITPEPSAEVSQHPSEVREVDPQEESFKELIEEETIASPTEESSGEKAEELETSVEALPIVENIVEAEEEVPSAETPEEPREEPTKLEQPLEDTSTLISEEPTILDATEKSPENPVEEPETTSVVEEPVTSEPVTSEPVADLQTETSNVPAEEAPETPIEEPVEEALISEPVVETLERPSEEVDEEGSAGAAEIIANPIIEEPVADMEPREVLEAMTYAKDEQAEADAEAEAEATPPADASEGPLEKGFGDDLSELPKEQEPLTEVESEETREEPLADSLKETTELAVQTTVGETTTDESEKAIEDDVTALQEPAELEETHTQSIEEPAHQPTINTAEEAPIEPISSTEEPEITATIPEEPAHEHVEDPMHESGPPAAEEITMLPLAASEESVMTSPEIVTAPAEEPAQEVAPAEPAFEVPDEPLEELTAQPEVEPVAREAKVEEQLVYEAPVAESTAHTIEESSPDEPVEGVSAEEKEESITGAPEIGEHDVTTVFLNQSVAEDSPLEAQTGTESGIEEAEMSNDSLAAEHEAEPASAEVDVPEIDESVEQTLAVPQDDSSVDVLAHMPEEQLVQEAEENEADEPVERAETEDDESVSVQAKLVCISSYMSQDRC